MAGRPVLAQFEMGLATSLMARDGFKRVLAASMSVRAWPDEGLDGPPTCAVCGASLEGPYLAFREERDTDTWFRVCLNRVWCRAMASDPPDPEELQSGDAWFRRVAALFRSATF